MRKFSKALIFSLILLMGKEVNSQIINNYGLKLGVGLANQKWTYKHLEPISISQNNKIGFIGQLIAETSLGNYLTFRPSIGYIQKGFIDSKENIEDIFLTEETGNNKVILHDLSLDLSLKISPLQTKTLPYLILGARGDYLLDYEGVPITSLNTELKKFTIGGVMGIGFIYNDFLFIEFEYNPAFSKNLNNKTLEIKDRYFCLTTGLFINTLAK